MSISLVKGKVLGILAGATNGYGKSYDDFLLSLQGCDEQFLSPALVELIRLEVLYEDSFDRFHIRPNRNREPILGVEPDLIAGFLMAYIVSRNGITIAEIFPLTIRVREIWSDCQQSFVLKALQTRFDFLSVAGNLNLRTDHNLFTEPQNFTYFAVGNKMPPGIFQEAPLL